MPAYVIHFCKNKQCNSGWIDEDLTRAHKPPQWKYCAACVEKGFVNPEKPQVNKRISESTKKRWEDGSLKRSR